MALFSALMVATSVGFLAYFEDDNPLAVRLIMIVMVPVTTVGGGFMAAELRRSTPKKQTSASS